MKQQINLLKSKFLSSDIAKRMASGAIWSFTGTALAKFIVLVAGILCARILTQEEYGEFGMVRSTINTFVVFGMAGIGLTATKYISEYKKTQQSKISGVYILTNGFALLTGILITLLIYYLASYLAVTTLNAPHLQRAIQLGAVLLFFTVLNSAQNGTLAGLENFKAIALNTLWGSIAESILMLVGAYYAGVMGAILGYGCGFVVLYICNHISIRKSFKNLKIKIVFSNFNKDYFKILYRFTLPAALSSFMVTPTYWIIRTMLVNKCGFDELAIYEAADQWKIIILFIPSAISNVVLPILSGLSTENNQKQFWKILRINLFLNAGIAFILALIISSCSPLIMSFYGSTYTDYSVLIILCFSTVFSAIANIVGLSISSRAKMWVGFAFNMCWSFMIISFSILFLSLNFGALGCALALLCAYILHSIAQLVYLYYINSKQYG